MTVVSWIDVFTRPNHKDAVIESLIYCIKNKGLNIYAYCIMTNHIHLIVNTNEPFILKDTIRDLKKFISKKVIQQILTEPESRREWMIDEFLKNGQNSKKHTSYKFWQSSNHAIELYNHKFTWDKVMYIHNNPVKDKYVNLPQEWKYSSASNYMNLPSLIESIECISQPMSIVK